MNLDENHVQAALSPALMDRLSAMHISALTSQATRGVGERQSAMSGNGMEFAEYRAYRAGDDLRHVDPRSLALGAPLTRTYVQRRQLLVTIILDLTPSMISVPEKSGLASALASALGFVALVGQDRVQLLVLDADNAVRRSPVWQGRNRAAELFAFAQSDLTPVSDREVAEPKPALSSLAESVESIRANADAGTIVVVLSDFWETRAAQSLRQLASSRAAVVAIQILSAAERDPSVYGEGVHRLVDAETGHERDITIDATMLSKYRQALETLQQSLESAVSARNIFISVPAEESLSTLCFETLPQAGVIA
jgi:uncharacterized protein (DUF58 family)